jgi:hypothetical protein
MVAAAWRLMRSQRTLCGVLGVEVTGSGVPLWPAGFSIQRAPSNPLASCLVSTHVRILCERVDAGAPLDGAPHRPLPIRPHGARQ